MPTDETGEALAAAFRDPLPAPNWHAGLRLALGVAGLFVLGMALQWHFAYLSAVLAATFLQAPAAPSFRAGIAMFAVTLAIMLLLFGLFSILLPYPVSFLIAQVLLVIWVFSMSVGGKPAPLVLVSLMGVMMVPFMAQTSLHLARLIAVWLPLNMAFALIASWLVFTLFPSDKGAAQQAERSAEAARHFDPDRRLLRMTLVTLPFLVAFQLLQGGALLTLIYVAMLTQQLAESTADGAAVARVKMLSTLAGGLAALLAYELLVIDTNLGFMIVVVLLLCLGFARWLFSGGPEAAALAGGALTTALILLGGAMAPFGDDVELAMIDRLVGVGAALVWVLVAFVVVDRFLPERETGPDLSWKAQKTVRRGRGQNPKAAAPRA